MVTLVVWFSAGATLLPSTRSKCRLASGTHTTHVRATVQTGQESDQRLTLGSCTRLDAGRHDGTRQVETVRVDETSFALRLLDAFHLTFTSGKHLFMLERASVTTAQHELTPASHRSAAGFQWNGGYGGCSSMAVSSSVASSSAYFSWSVWSLPCSRARSGVARKWPSGHLVLWSASASNARGV